MVEIAILLILSGIIWRGDHLWEWLVNRWNDHRDQEWRRYDKSCWSKLRSEPHHAPPVMPGITSADVRAMANAEADRELASALRSIESKAKAGECCHVLRCEKQPDRVIAKLKAMGWTNIEREGRSCVFIVRW